MFMYPYCLASYVVIYIVYLFLSILRVIPKARGTFFEKKYYGFYGMTLNLN